MKNVEKKQKFSIRKLSVGVFSLCIGSFILGYLPTTATNTKITADLVNEQSLSDSEKQKIINTLPSDIASNASYHLVYRINPKMTPQLWLVTGALLATGGLLLVLSIKKSNKKAIIIGATIVSLTAIAIPIIRLSAIGIKSLPNDMKVTVTEDGGNIVVPEVDNSLYTFVGYLPYITNTEVKETESKQEVTSTAENTQETTSTVETKQKVTTKEPVQKNTPVDIQKAKSEYETLYNQKILNLESSTLTIEEKETIKNKLQLLKEATFQAYEKAQAIAELNAKQDDAIKQLAKNDVVKSEVKTQAIANIDQAYDAKKLEINNSELTEEEKIPYLETLNASKNNVANIMTALNNAEVADHENDTVEKIHAINVGNSVIKQSAKQLIEEAYQAKLAEIQSSRLLQEEKNEKINDLELQKNTAIQKITDAKHNNAVETQKKSTTETMQSLVVGESPAKSRLKRSIEEIYQAQSQKLAESIFTPEQQQAVATTLLEIKTTLERQVDESENITQISNIENTLLPQLTSVDVGMNKKEALKNQLIALINEIENAGVKYHNYEPTIKAEIDQSLTTTKALLQQDDSNVDALSVALITMRQYREILDHPTNNGETRLQSAINNAKTTITDRKEAILLALQPENFPHLNASRINEVRTNITAKTNEFIARLDNNTFNLNVDIETFATEALTQLSLATLEEENTKAGLVSDIQTLVQEIPTLSTYINASETYKSLMDTLLALAQQSLSDKNIDELITLKSDLVAKKTDLDGEQQLQNNKNNAKSAINTAYEEKRTAIQNAQWLEEERAEALQQLTAIKNNRDEAISNATNNDAVRVEKESGINEINAIAVNESQAKTNAK